MPTGTTPGLALWLSIVSSETASAADDVLFMMIRNTSGTVL
jgi:hypothetical protein